MFVFVYVDDIFFTSFNPFCLEEFVTTLCDKFVLKDTGSLTFFLGIQVTQTSQDLHLEWVKYIIDMLQRVGLMHTKPTSTSMASWGVLGKKGGNVLTDPTDYRSLVGTLQNCVLLRLDNNFFSEQILSIFE